MDWSNVSQEMAEKSLAKEKRFFKPLSRLRLDWISDPLHWRGYSPHRQPLR